MWPKRPADCNLAQVIRVTDPLSGFDFFKIKNPHFNIYWTLNLNDKKSAENTISQVRTAPWHARQLETQGGESSAGWREQIRPVKWLWERFRSDLCKRVWGTRWRRPNSDYAGKSVRKVNFQSFLGLPGSLRSKWQIQSEPSRRSISVSGVGLPMYRPPIILSHILAHKATAFARVGKSNLKNLKRFVASFNCSRC